MLRDASGFECQRDTSALVLARQAGPRGTSGKVKDSNTANSPGPRPLTRHRRLILGIPPLVTLGVDRPTWRAIRVDGLLLAGKAETNQFKAERNQLGAEHPVAGMIPVTVVLVGMVVMGTMVAVVIMVIMETMVIWNRELVTS